VNYKQKCAFTLEVEAFIDSTSFGTYTSFTYTVENECMNFKASAPHDDLWQLKTYYPDDPVPPLDSVGLKNNYYMIWFDAPTQSWALPRLVGTLTSETLGYPSFSDECGPTIYSTGDVDISNVATIDFASYLEFPVLTVQSTNSSHGGISPKENYRKTYTVALQAIFEKWPDLGIFKYEETRTMNQPPLSFDMQDRCLEMYYDHPLVTYSKPTSVGMNLIRY
jgi:hypothetical protein